MGVSHLIRAFDIEELPEELLPDIVLPPALEAALGLPLVPHL